MSEVIGDPGVFDATYHTYTTFLMSELLTTLINGDQWYTHRPTPAVVSSEARGLLQTLADAHSTRPPRLLELVGDRQRLRRYEEWLQKLKLDEPLAGDEDRQTATELRDLLQIIREVGEGQQDVDLVSDHEDDDE